MEKAQRQEMMQSMIEQFFGDMGIEEKKEMCSAMMAKLTEGVDMKEMMPKIMMGMMSGGAGHSPEKMQGGFEHQMSQMPEMMLKTMMPHCIGMMLPIIDTERRAEVATAIVLTIVEKGPVEMSNEQKHSFFRALEEYITSLK